MGGGGEGFPVQKRDMGQDLGRDIYSAVAYSKRGVLSSYQSIYHLSVIFFNAEYFAKPLAHSPGASSTHMKKRAFSVYLIPSVVVRFVE